MQDQTSRIAAQLLRAALAHFDAERQNALAVLDVYLHKPTAISDHSQLVQEIVKATQRLAEAEDSIEALERHFLSSSPNPIEDEANGE